MVLPVLCGPNRCALVYSQDRQPLIELSLQVNLPVVKKLLRALSQVAPRTAQPAPPWSSLAIKEETQAVIADRRKPRPEAADKNESAQD